MRSLVMASAALFLATMGTRAVVPALTVTQTSGATFRAAWDHVRAPEAVSEFELQLWTPQVGGTRVWTKQFAESDLTLIARTATTTTQVSSSWTSPDLSIGADPATYELRVRARLRQADGTYVNSNWIATAFMWPLDVTVPRAPGKPVAGR